MSKRWHVRLLTSGEILEKDCTATCITLVDFSFLLKPVVLQHSIANDNTWMKFVGFFGKMVMIIICWLFKVYSFESKASRLSIRLDLDYIISIGAQIFATVLTYSASLAGKWMASHVWAAAMHQPHCLWDLYIKPGVPPHLLWLSMVAVQFT